MNCYRQALIRRSIIFGTGFFLIGAAGCKKTRSESSHEGAAAVQTRSNSSPSESRLDGGKYCLEIMAQNPAAASSPIHFSYKVNESDGSAKDFESTLSGDTLDVTIRERHPATDLDRELSATPGSVPITIRDGFAETEHTNHYTRSDGSGWTAGWGSMVQGGTPWSLFILKPPSTQAGSENISGYDTTKYSVDTTHQSQMEKLAGTASWNVKDYQITGLAWATRDTGCILQYNIDLEKDGKDGKVSKTHFEGGITKQ